MDSPNQFPDPMKNESLTADLVTIRMRRSTLWMILLPVVFVFGLVGGYFLHDLPFLHKAVPAPQAAAVPTADSGGQTQQQIRRYDVPVDDDPSLGPSNAPITIIEFSDFQCPYCQKWQTEAWPKIQENFKDQVRLVYRDFPLDSIHENAASAAEAANCAGDQNKYWPFHDKLFRAEQGLGQTAYLQYAKDLGLDQTKFEECLTSRKYKDEVQADFQYAADLGINSTPTFFINGIPVVGAQPYEVFKQVIEKELAGEYTN